MNTYSIHEPLPSLAEDKTIQATLGGAAALDCHQATQLDVCRCPKCNGPMTARNGAKGPYFSCLCTSAPANPASCGCRQSDRRGDIAWR